MKYTNQRRRWIGSLLTVVGVAVLNAYTLHAGLLSYLVWVVSVGFVVSIVGGLVEDLTAPRSVEIVGEKVVVAWRSETVETQPAAITMRKTLGDYVGEAVESVHLCFDGRRAKLYADRPGYRVLLEGLVKRGARSMVKRYRASEDECD